MTSVKPHEIVLARCPALRGLPALHYCILYPSVPLSFFFFDCPPLGRLGEREQDVWTVPGHFSWSVIS